MVKNNQGKRDRGENRSRYRSGGVREMARERPVAAAGLAAAAVGAGVFLWSRRSQISEQLSHLSDQIGEMTSRGGSEEFEMADGGSSESWSSGSSSGSGGSSGEFMGSGGSGSMGSGMSGVTGMGSSSGSSGGKSGKGGRSGGSTSSASGSNRSRN